jgi:hypothetical protein
MNQAPQAAPAPDQHRRQTAGAGRAGLLVALVLLTGLAPLAFAGCGDGGEDDSGSVPNITIPEGKAKPVPDETTTTAPPSGGTPDPAKPDSPENDVPPEPGTPEEKFEQYCEENPGACG